jgi:hypothetical protein
MTEAIALVVTISIMNMVCFTLGTSVRQKVDKGKEVSMPDVNPVHMYHDHQKRKEQAKKASQREVLLRNIERYDGTPFGQEDIPR